MERTSGLSFAWMTQRPPTFGPIVDAARRVAAALGLEPRRPGSRHCRCRRCRAACRILLVPLRDHAAVDRAVSDAAAFRRLCAACGLDLPIFLFCRWRTVAGRTVYSRMFAPEFGIIEDPATGSASGRSAATSSSTASSTAMRRSAIVSQPGCGDGTAEPHPHRRSTATPSAITEVKVGGEAVLVGRGELLV